MVRLICFHSQIFPQEPLSVSVSRASVLISILAAGAEAAIMDVSIQILSATGVQ